MVKSRPYWSEINHFMQVISKMKRASENRLDGLKQSRRRWSLIFSGFSDHDIAWNNGVNKHGWLFSNKFDVLLYFYGRNIFQKEDFYRFNFYFLNVYFHITSI